MAASKSRKSFKRDIAPELTEADAVFGPEAPERAEAASPERRPVRTHRITVEFDDDLYRAMKRHLLEPDCIYKNSSDMLRGLVAAEVGTDR